MSLVSFRRIWFSQFIGLGCERKSLACTVTSCPRMLDEGSTTGEPTSIERTVGNHTRKCADGSERELASTERLTRWYD